MKLPVTAVELVDIAIAVDDIYTAAAVFDIANHLQQQALERVMFTRRRDVLILASWEHTPAAVLQALTTSEDASVKLRLAKHQKVSNKSAVKEDASNVNITKYALELLKQAKDTSLPLAVLKTLAVDTHAAVRAKVAANTAFPAEDSAVFAQDESAAVRRALAARHDIDADIMRQLSVDSDDWVRQRLGRNPSLSLGIMQQLATDDVDEVRRAITRNKNCPIELLERLAKDRCAWVRAGVAYQVNASSDLMRELVADKDIDVLSGVASNPNTPASIQLSLAQHDDADVRRGVILNPKVERETLLPLLEDPYYLHRILLLGSSKLTASDKWSLHDDPDYRVRFLVFRWFADALKKHQSYSLSVESN